jgi:hypothetical protein
VGALFFLITPNESPAGGGTATNARDFSLLSELCEQSPYPFPTDARAGMLDITNAKLTGLGTHCLKHEFRLGTLRRPSLA